MTIQRTTDFPANSEEVVTKIATELSTSDGKLKVFEAIYSGGNKPKDTALLSTMTGLTEVKVSQLATPMAHKDYFEGGFKVGKRNAFKKYNHINAEKARILRYAEPGLMVDVPTKRKQAATINVKVRTVSPRQIRVRQIFIDDIDDFARARPLKASDLPKLTPKRLPEKLFKYGTAAILGNRGQFQDWGGEKNDLYSTNMKIGGKRVLAAFAFKGPATSPPLVPGKLGKNGDQIQRLFSTNADVFFVQFEGRIEESVPEQMLACATRKSFETGREILLELSALRTPIGCVPNMQSTFLKTISQTKTSEIRPSRETI